MGEFSPGTSEPISSRIIALRITAFSLFFAKLSKSMLFVTYKAEKQSECRCYIHLCGKVVSLTVDSQIYRLWCNLQKKTFWKVFFHFKARHQGLKLRSLKSRFTDVSEYYCLCSTAIVCFLVVYAALLVSGHPLGSLLLLTFNCQTSTWPKSLEKFLKM